MEKSIRMRINKVLSSLLAVSLMVAPVINHFDTEVTAAIITDGYEVPASSANGTVGAKMPYTRYDSEQAVRSEGAKFLESSDFSNMKVATQASNQSYVKLYKSGDYAEWKITTAGNGVTMRYTMPDSSDGKGKKGSLDVYVNGRFDQKVELSSYSMWQYFLGGNPSDVPNNGAPLFAFDEVHFKLNNSLKAGDTIRIQSSGDGGLEYGIDFLEIEEVPAVIPQPSNSINVEEYGAIPNDGKDDYTAISNAIYVAKNLKKDVYIPEGTFELSQVLKVSANNIKITGAGMWYTNLHFTSDQINGGGISGNCSNVEFCNMYINSNLCSRYGEKAAYKCFMDIFENCVFHDIWEEHFECGFWFADYVGNSKYSDGTKIVNCRIRNNLADGVNFCQGTSNAAVYNCSIRNNGDDGLAMWNNNYRSKKDETGNIFAYNTIDFIWRAGAIAIYGGDNHKIYNNYIRDTTMSSGIHLNTTFDGYKFSKTKAIYFENNVLIKSGCQKDSWGGTLASIDIQGDVKNIVFNSNSIYEPQAAPTRTVNNANIVFNNTNIYSGGNGYVIPSYPVAEVFDPLSVKTQEPGTATQSNVKTTEQTTAQSNVQTTKQSIGTVKVGRTAVKSATKKKKSKNIKLKLKKVSGVTGYKLQISTTKKFKKILITKTVKKINFTVKNKKLKNRKKLYVRAKAYVKVGSKKYYSRKWSVVKKVKIKK